MKIPPTRAGGQIAAGDDSQEPTRGQTMPGIVPARTSGSSSTPPRSGSPVFTSSTGSASQDWGAAAALIHPVTVKDGDGDTRMHLSLPRGMLEHPLQNSAGLGAEAIKQQLQEGLRNLPAGAAVWLDDFGQIQSKLGAARELDVQFNRNGQITAVLLKGGPQPFQLTEESWLRGALSAAGTTVPPQAALWRLPRSGEPVSCEWNLPPAPVEMPQAFKDATGNADQPQLLTQALDALSGGGARNHSNTVPGKAQCEFDLFGQTLRVDYQHARHAVQSLHLTWLRPQAGGIQELPVAQWGGLDADVLALAETGRKRKAGVDFSWSDDEEEATRRSETRAKVFGHETQILDVGGGDIDTTLDQLFGQAITPDRPTSPVPASNASNASSASRASSPSALPIRTPVPRGPLEPLPIPVASVLLSYRARERVAVDTELTTLANCFKGLFDSAPRIDNRASARATPSTAEQHSALKMPAVLRPFLDAVLQGEGSTPTGAHASVRVFEKTFATPYSGLPATVRDMPCVLGAAGNGTTVKLVALVRPDRPDRFTEVRRYSAENVAALDAAARAGDEAGEMQPLPTPGEINDTLEDLFEGKSTAPVLRLLALLQTPRYRLSNDAIAGLTVAADGQSISGVTFVGQDDGLADDAPDNDWTRIVKPWLEQRSRVHRSDNALGIPDHGISNSFRTLTEALPALGHMFGKNKRAESALEGAAAAALETAGVPPKFLRGRDTGDTTVLKLGHVAEDGSCAPATLSEAGRSALRAWAAHRLESLGDLSLEEKRQQPLFTFDRLSDVKARISAYWKKMKEVSLRSASGPHSGLVSLPQAGEVNDLLSGLFVDEPHPELSRAWARLRLPPYCLGYTQIEALRIQGGEIVASGNDGVYAPLQIAGRNDGIPQNGADNDWLRIFKPHLDALSVDGTQPIGDGAFGRHRNHRGLVVNSTAGSNSSDAMSSLSRAAPELGFLLGSGSTSDAMQALTATTLRAAGAMLVHLYGTGVLKLSDVGIDGNIAQAQGLSDDGKHIVLVWKQLCERNGKGADDALFSYSDPRNLRRAMKGHCNRLTTAFQRAAAPQSAEPFGVPGSSRSAP